MNMAKMLISVWHDFAELIASGEKSWEFRKSCPKKCRYYLYLCNRSGFQHHCGCRIKKIYNWPKTKIWEENVRLGNPGKISKGKFDAYYKGDFGTVFVLDNPKKIDIPLAQIEKIIPNFHPPQNYIYLQYETIEVLCSSLKAR